MAITTPVSGDSPAIVFNQNPTAVYDAQPGTSSFVEVTLTGAAASASWVQYMINATNNISISLDGTNTIATVGNVDAPVVITAKPNIFVKGSAGSSNAEIFVISYQLGGIVST
tara:strand:+ start:249 stop:587 length:339 start_codon:yes stop_codon:yes gene_type:complete